MRVFIAEKPSVAADIVAALGGGTRKNGFYLCGDDAVTWLVGHVLALQEPEDYNPAYSKWNFGDLPIIQVPWKMKVNESTADQLQIVQGLLEQASSIVHAGDPDEEGQLLVDEVLQYFNIGVPVKRVLINDGNIKVVQRALANMRENTEPEFVNASQKALSRSVCDQFYGINMSRAYTLVAQRMGYRALLTVGRVQTPILGLVVRRTRENKAHVKAYFYKITAQVQFDELAFPVRYLPTDSDPMDDKKRIIDPAFAQQVCEQCRGADAHVESIATQVKTEPPPLLYNLLKLQQEASRKFGFMPDETLDITQALREKYKLITYNRSDCQYLNDDHHADAPNVLAAIVENADMFKNVVAKADPAIKSRAFNSEKVSAHHGIIPTIARANLDQLTDQERKIYLLIARSYIAQFWPQRTYEETKVAVAIAGHHFAATANTTLVSGWRALYANDTGNDELQADKEAVGFSLKALQTGQAGIAAQCDHSQEETKPLPLYTMEKLLSDLTRVAKYIKDERLRQILKDRDKGKEGEHGGIGTPATRASIIKNLFERAYLEMRGKSIVSTALGETFYDVLPDQARFPDMTARWHEQQQRIASGEETMDGFINDVVRYITDEVARVDREGLDLKAIPRHQCPQCKEGYLNLFQGKHGPFWGCSNHAESGCKSLPDKGGKPDLSHDSRPTVSQLHKCVVCGKGLIRRPTKKNLKVFFWGCSGFPECKSTYPDAAGKPNLVATLAKSK